MLNESCIVFFALMYDALCDFILQPFKSIRAFHLSNLLMTRLDTSDAKDILELRTTVSCEPTRLLVDLFDLPSAIAVLGNAPVNSELDTYSSTQLQVTKAIVLTKAGEVCYLVS